MSIRILQGDCRTVLSTIASASINCCVTSPPYFGLRDYGVAGQRGLEATPAEFVDNLVQDFREVRRVLRDDGTLWLNLGDSYAGSWGARSRGADTNAPARDLELKHGTAAPARNGFADEGIKPKDLIGIPWRVAFALQSDGWYLRQGIVWHKPNGMPESVLDRCTTAHEFVFLLAKSPDYYCDMAAIAEEASGDPEAPRNRWDRSDDEVPGQKPQKRKARAGSVRHLAYDTCGQEGLDARGRTGMRNKRSVWTIATQPFAEAHFATMAPELAATCIKAGCPTGGTVLDPFGGAGTTGLVADGLQREAVLIELNPDYIEIARRRIAGDAPLFAEVST